MRRNAEASGRFIDVVDIDAAIGYVVAHSDPVERARLSFLRAQVTPAQEVLDRIEARQTPSGGWPASGDSTVASVDATCFRLAELDDIGALLTPGAGRALEWLAAVQQDGVWEEDGSLAAEAPVWAMPGDPEARLYLSSVAGFWLAVADGQGRSGEPDPDKPGRYSAVLQAAAGQVVGQLRPDGTWPSFLAAGWHIAGLLYDQQFFYESARVQYVLGDRLPGMAPADLASMGAALRRIPLGVDDWLLQAVRKRLTETQRTDGGWDSAEGPIFDVNTTITALRACL
jgi:hypothetical protein